MVPINKIKENDAGREGGGLILSICIATRNRAKFLAETLDNIRAQIDDRVEIVVVDGGSSDNTPVFMAEQVEQDSRIKYSFQKENGGIDRDYDLAVTFAQGRYCWLMSDDDYIKPDAIKTVLKACSLGYSFIFVDAEVRSFDFSEILESSRANLSSDREYLAGDLDELFLDTASALSFIGSTVIDRALWLSRDRSRYFGSYFIHVGVLFQQELPKGALAIAKPLVEIRYGNASWSARSFDIWMVKWPELLWSFDKISVDAKRRVIRQKPWTSYMELLRWRAKGRFSAAECRELIENNSVSYFNAVAAIIISRMPYIIMEPISLMYIFLLSKNRRMALSQRKKIGAVGLGDFL